MDPSRKRRIRLGVALTAAVLLAGALMYTSFGSSTKAETPSKLLSAAQPGRSYEVTGKVASGSVKREGETLRFAIRDRNGKAKIPVVYTGTVPDPFREGREVIVSGRVKNGVLIGERDSLVTKCPSKFTKAPEKS
jgi:cytochrome c-type biogenesis protein CcmE